VTTNVRRLQPLRIVVSGRDRRFVRVTSFLLGRRGYDVRDARAVDVVDAAEQHRADVVVLELAGGSRVTAGRAMTALQASDTSPAVLLVCEGADGRWNGFPIVEKWIPIERLVDEIEAAALHRIPPTQAAREAEHGLQSL
jgi:hypothetical protein